MSRPFVVAVTGGIGSGKSTVCDLFAERHGVRIIDADRIAREVVEPGEPGLEAIVQAFGEGVLDADGRLDRARMKQLVFADPDKRRTLEGILHPRIRDRMEQGVRAAGGPYCLLAIPLLAEGGGNPLADRVLVVDCSEQTQIRRVVERDDLTEAEVAAIMRSQATRESRGAIADDVLLNDGDAASLVPEVDALHERYVELAAAQSQATIR